jgi:hypothetical protein
VPVLLAQAPALAWRQHVLVDRARPVVLAQQVLAHRVVEPAVLVQRLLSHQSSSAATARSTR